MTGTRILVNTREFIALVKRVLPHVPKPGAGPEPLEVIRFSTRGQELVAIASDRYSVIETRIPLVGAYERPEVDFCVFATELKALLPQLQKSEHTVLEARELGAGATIAENTLSGLEVSRLPALARLFPKTFEKLEDQHLALGVAQAKKLAATLPAPKRGQNTHFVVGKSRTVGRTSSYVLMVGTHTRICLTSMAPMESLSSDAQLEEDWASWG